MTDLIRPTRRGFLTGLACAIVAPAIVRAESLMPVRAIDRLWIDPRCRDLIRALTDYRYFSVGVDFGRDEGTAVLVGVTDQGVFSVLEEVRGLDAHGVMTVSFKTEIPPGPLPFHFDGKCVNDRRAGLRNRSGKTSDSLGMFATRRER